MVNNLLTLVPFLIVFVMAIILIGSPLEIKTKSILAIFSLLLALLIDIILLISPIEPSIMDYVSDQQNVQLYIEVFGPYFSYLIQGIILCISLVIYFRFNQILHQIHSK